MSRVQSDVCNHFIAKFNLNLVEFYD
jgi:hypothetical protein